MEIAKSIDDLMTWQSIEGKAFPDFQNASCEDSVCTEKDHLQFQLQKKSQVEEQRAQKHDRFLGRRQVASMIHEHSQATEAYDAPQGLADLFNICFHDDDVQDFDTWCDQIQ